MSSYIDISLNDSEIITRYRVTDRTARAILTLLHHNNEAAEEDAPDQNVTIKFDTKKEKDDFIQSIRAAVRQALEDQKEDQKKTQGLKPGDLIKCADAQDAGYVADQLCNLKINFDFVYEHNGEEGIWIEILPKEAEHANNCETR